MMRPLVGRMDLLRRFDVIIVFLLIVCAMAWAIWNGPLVRTEPHRAIPAMAMADGAPLLYPTLFGRPYLRKPPLQYWMLAGAVEFTGSTDAWVFRLPSVLCSGVLGAFLCWMARRWFGHPAGLMTGLAYLALFPMWGQARSADIDMLHTLCVVVGAVSMIEFARPPGHSTRWPWWLLGCLACCGAMLAKGPAGFTVLLGAIVGLVWFDRPRRWNLLLPLGLMIGIASAAFLGWGYTARQAIDAAGLPFDTSGAGELGRKLIAWNWQTLWGVLLLPVMLLVASLPSGLGMIFAQSGWLYEFRARWVIVALIRTFFISIAIAMLFCVSNQRYMYIALPLLCPLMGAVCVAWRKNRYTARQMRIMQDLLGTIMVGLMGFAAGLAAVTRWHEGDLSGWPLVFGIAALAVGAVAYRQLVLDRRPLSIGIFAAVLVLGAALHGQHRVPDRWNTSSFQAADELAALLDGEPLLLGHWSIVGPELIHYAHVEASIFSWNLSDHPVLPEHAWILFHESEEWEPWQAIAQTPVAEVHVLPTRSRNAILVRTGTNPVQDDSTAAAGDKARRGDVAVQPD
jgi:4-amino-4-deoxy-L-arabinose transferase-like glycosyltransferase